MLIYLDSAIVIYAIEADSASKLRALSRLAMAHQANENLATSDLTRLECLVLPFRRANTNAQQNYRQFLASTVILNCPPSVYDRAARIRADHNFGLADALHIATAIEGKCDVFLTNDARLFGFPGILVEQLA